MLLGLLYFSLSCMTVRHLSLLFKKDEPKDAIDISCPSPTLVEGLLRFRNDETEDDDWGIKRSWTGAASDRCLPTLSHPSNGSLTGAYSQLVGRTPLLHLRKLSEMLHCDIYAKVRWLRLAAVSCR